MAAPTSSGVRVQPATSATEWDAFVRAQPAWSHHHLYGWREIMEGVFGHECLYFEARDDAGSLRGILPLVRVKSPIFGHFLVSMPFVNYGGPLGDHDAIRALVSHAAAQSMRDGAKLLELRSRNEQPLDLTVSHRKITVVLDLPPEGSDALFKKLDSKVRSQVRRPGKEGVTYAFGADQVDPFYEVFAHHMRDLGTPVLSRSFFREIARVFPESSWFGCAYLNGQPIACGAGMRAANEFEITWASSLRAFNRTSANMGLYWEFMQRACADGATVFNFGRCTPGGGTHKYKRQWGGRDEQLWWYHQSRDQNAATPSPEEGGALSLGPRVWKHLPVPVATFLGPRIVKYIP